MKTPEPNDVRSAPLRLWQARRRGASADGARWPLAAFGDWPRRRWFVTGLLIGPMVAAYLALTSGASNPWWTWAAASISGTLAALILASYVAAPGSRQVLDVGCSPCAVVAALAIVGSFLLRSDTPYDEGRAWLGVGLLAFGVMQRLSDNQSCALPSGPGG